MNKHTKKLMALIKPIAPQEIKRIMTKNNFKMLKKTKTKIDKKHNLYGLVFVSAVEADEEE